MALLLARYFRTSPDVWTGLQADYDLYWARMKSKKAIDEIKPHIKSKTARSQERSTGTPGAGNYRYGKKELESQTSGLLLSKVFASA